MTEFEQLTIALPDEPAAVPPTPEPITSPRLGAARAFGIFALGFVAQFMLGMFAVIAGIVYMVANGGNPSDSKQIANVVAQLTAPLIVAGVLAMAGVTYAMMKAWSPSWLRDRSADGFGEPRLGGRQFAIATLSGLALSAVYLTITRLIPVPHGAAGPLAQMAARGGATRATWAFVAVALAPITEEVLFRGLMFKGFRESWGTIPAAIIVTFFFWGSHLTEVVHYWPAALAVLMLAVLTMIIRVKSRSVLSAVVVHTSYNGLIVAALYAGLVR